MSFHPGQTFTFGEQPSATKWQWVWDNDYALQDWSAFTADSFPLSLIADRTRTAPIRIQADNTGGAVTSNNEGPEVQFSGTPTGYARGVARVPEDWVPGTDILIKLTTRASATNSGEGTTHFVGIHKHGDTFASWNEQSSIAGNQSWTIDVINEFTMYTIPAANIEAGDYITFAWRVNTALSGNVYLVNAFLEYTADM